MIFYSGSRSYQRSIFRNDWYIKDTLHRDNGPARIYSDGTKLWYQNGLCHREGGPAIISPYGYKAWKQNNFFHRDDGPARINPNIFEEWWVRGRFKMIFKY